MRNDHGTLSDDQILSGGRHLNDRGTRNDHGARNDIRRGDLDWKKSAHRYPNKQTHSTLLALHLPPAHECSNSCKARRLGGNTDRHNNFHA